MIDSIDELAMILILGTKPEIHDMNNYLKNNIYNLPAEQEIYCDDDVDRSGIEECKRRTEDLFKECGLK